MKDRVLFLVQLPPPVHGASLMNKMIKDSKLVNEKFSCTFFDISPENEQKNLGRFSFIKFFRVIACYAKLFYMLVFNRFNLCYFTLSPVGFAFYKDLIYVSILKLFRVKIIFHLHGKGIKNNSTGFKRFLYRFTFNKTDVIHLADTLFGDISTYSDVIKNKYTLANGITVVNLDSFSRNSEDIVAVTYLSNLIPSKGAHVLLEAISYLPEEYSKKFKFNIAGGGRDATYNLRLKELASLSSCFDICLLGPVYNEDKYKLLRSSDVFVLPTTYKNECFPLSILEAMQFGLAICTTNEGAIPEIISPSNGFIFNASEPMQLAEALKKLVNDKDLLSSYQQVSRSLFIENYTFDVFEQKLVNILENSMER